MSDGNKTRASDVTPESIKKVRKSGLRVISGVYVEDVIDALEAAWAERDRLRSALASRPVAVEVPERPFPVLDLHGEPMRGISLTMYCRGWDDLASKLQTVPPSRLLKEGHVQVPVEEWDRVRAAGMRLLDAVKEYHDYKHNGDPWTEDARVMQETSIDDLRGDPIKEIEDALRSNGGAKEAQDAPT